jgi:3-isopropylmalate/(R)-2-methylmalate dehydratase small subunit
VSTFETITSKVVHLPAENVDTDQIIPARFLKTIDRKGLADGLFADWRYDADGRPRGEFVLNRPEMHGREVLLAGDNFGCGSSREHAPWALRGFGFRAVVSTSFADIFRANALKNGLLPVALDPATHERLSQLVDTDPDAEVTVDLERQVVRLPDGAEAAFEVDDFARAMLLQGTDELGYLLAHTDAIAAWEAANAPQVRTVPPLG